MSQMKASFIIPALNEAHNIGNTLDSIHEAVKKTRITWHEIIVVDHGSSDDTATIAQAHGAIVTVTRGGTIAGLRNRGAQQAEGNILIFIDADVTLTQEWALHIDSVAERLLQGEKLITGSHCAPPDSQNPLMKYWFASLVTDPRNTHVGTGHMMLSAEAFGSIGGFDSNLRTGEDYEFCERAKRNGYSVANNPDLKVVHHDFPDTLSAFIAREAWHGAGDLSSLTACLNSKVVLASTAFLIIHALLACAIITRNLALGIAGGCALALLLLASSYAKNRHTNFVTILINAAIFYFYYLGRSLAVLKKLIDFFRPAKR